MPESPLNENATLPVWDFVSTCQIKGKDGFLLIEAKANEGELDWDGKELPRTASDQSVLNHAHIAAAISEICRQLEKALGDKVALGIASHYQLANRVAWSAKLAGIGIPVVLVYLGFIGDTYFPWNLRDAGHWERVMGAYMHGMLPLSLPGRQVTFPCGGTWSLLVCSRHVREPSK